MNANIQYEVSKQHIGIITLNRPEAANAMSKHLLLALQEQIQQINNDATIRTVIITGAGTKAFCAGADLKERKAMTDEEVIEAVQLIGKTISIVECIQVPTIAVLNGVAFGGGLELALACDIRIAKKGIQLGLPETSLGIIPGAGGTQRLPRLIGLGQAKKLIFTAKPIDSSEAQTIGLIEKVVQEENLLNKAIECAEAIVKNAPIAIKQAKIAIDRGIELPLVEGLATEHASYKQTIDTEDRIEGLQAFAEKRRPIYVGK